MPCSLSFLASASSTMSVQELVFNDHSQQSERYSQCSPRIRHWQTKSAGYFEHYKAHEIGDSECFLNILARGVEWRLHNFYMALGRAPWWSVISRLGPLRGPFVSGLPGQMLAAQGHIASPRPKAIPTYLCAGAAQVLARSSGSLCSQIAN